MNNLEKLLNNYNIDFIGGVSEDEIKKSEEKLNFSFTEEFKDYLKTFGVISYGSEEILGLGVKGYLNVVETTIKEREFNENLKGLVVLQCNGEYLITMDLEGNIYQSTSFKNERIYSSFLEFLKKEILKEN